MAKGTRSKNSKAKNTAAELQKIARYEASLRRKTRNRNILTVGACLIAAFAVVVTFALVQVNLPQTKDNVADGLPEISDSEFTGATDITISDWTNLADDDLRTKVITAGDGEEITAADTISANYTGWTTDGKMFDSSYKSGSQDPVSFSLTGVIKGWTQGLTGKHVGDVVELAIPSKMAYDHASGSPDGDLIFMVKIASKGEATPAPAAGAGTGAEGAGATQ